MINGNVLTRDDVFLYNMFVMGTFIVEMGLMNGAKIAKISLNYARVISSGNVQMRTNVYPTVKYVMATGTAKMVQMKAFSSVLSGIAGILS